VSFPAFFISVWCVLSLLPHAWDLSDSPLTLLSPLCLVLLSCFFLSLWSRVYPSAVRVLSACLASEPRMIELLPQGLVPVDPVLPSTVISSSCSRCALVAETWMGAGTFLMILRTFFFVRFVQTTCSGFLPQSSHQPWTGPTTNIFIFFLGLYEFEGNLYFYFGRDDCLKRP